MTVQISTPLNTLKIEKTTEHKIELATIRKGISYMTCKMYKYIIVYHEIGLNSFYFYVKFNNILTSVALRIRMKTFYFRESNLL